MCADFIIIYTHIYIYARKFPTYPIPPTTHSGSGHKGAVWGLDVRPDGKGLATGGADREVKFWEFEMVEAGTAVRVLFFVFFVCLNMYMDRAGAGVATRLASDAMHLSPLDLYLFF